MPLPVMAITLDQPRTLRYTWGALIRLEKQRGAMYAHVIRDLHFCDATAMRDVVWAGLLHEIPALTPEATEPLLDAYIEHGGTMHGLFEAWNKAVVDSQMLVVASPTDTKAGAEGNAGGGAPSS